MGVPSSRWADREPVTDEEIAERLAASPKNIDPDACRALAVAVVERAIEDANGRVSITGTGTPGSRKRHRDRAIVDAIDFLFTDRIEVWLTGMGIGADELRAGLVRGNHAGMRSHFLRLRRAGRLREVPQHWVDAIKAARETAAREFVAHPHRVRRSA